MGASLDRTLAPQKHHAVTESSRRVWSVILAFEEVCIDLNKAFPLFGNR